MANNKKILKNFQKSNDFNFLRGDLFMKYPSVQASDAVQAFKRGHDIMRARLQAAGDQMVANNLEQLLNTAAKAASFAEALKTMSSKIIDRMLSKGVEGMEHGINVSNIDQYVTYQNEGASFRRKTTAFKQAKNVYDWGQKNRPGQTMTTIKNAIGGGEYGNLTNNPESAYNFLYQLNNKLLTPEEIESLSQGFYDVSNLNGEILERILEAVGQTSFMEGQAYAEEQVNELLEAMKQLDVKSKTSGQIQRQIQLDIGDRQGAVVFNSQGKADAQFTLPDSTKLNLSAKSMLQLNREIALLTQANFMGLMGGAGITDRRSYSAFTVYTNADTYSSTSDNEDFKRMLLYQAFAGTTAQENDFANYMVFQVGTGFTSNDNEIKHFRVLSMKDVLVRSQQLNIKDAIKYIFDPDPLPIGAKTYIQTLNKKTSKLKQVPSKQLQKEYRYPRTEETFNQLFKAKISILLRSGIITQYLANQIK